MNWAAVKTLAPQAALIGGLIAAGFAAGLPAMLTVVLSFAAVAHTAAQVVSPRQPDAGRKWGLPVAWAFALAGMIGIFGAGCLLGKLSAIPSFLLAASVWLVSRQFSDAIARNRWRGLAMTWAFSGSVIWLATSYAGNQRIVFYISLVVNLALLILCKQWFRLRALGIQLVNTVILLLVGLPLASLLISGAGTSDGPVDPGKRYFSYEMGVQYPAKFAAWWNYFWTQWGQIAKEIQVHDDLARNLPFRLKRNARVKLVQSEIVINSLGFRGTNIPGEKGRTYRIVALGESTTFGLTYTPTDKPWPEWLEQIIRMRLKLTRPVEVINAGVVSYDLRQNLVRLTNDILPLKPDMVISYHGFNGFRFVDDSMPAISGAPPSGYHQRALPLLGDAEFKARTLLYNRRRAAERAPASHLTTDPMTSEYARVYRQLIEVARTSHIRLVLANFSMAVNGQSDPKVVEFYQRGLSVVPWAMRANEAHSAIVEELARENPGVTLLDTHPALDGKYDNYIDLVHFSEDGEHVMAETMFDGIRKILEQELSPAASLSNQP